MIKVIASDMDGTLLGSDHRLAPETADAVRRACAAGIRFIIATGRNFPSAKSELEGSGIECDYVVISGAEVRNQKADVISRCPISRELCREIYGEMKGYPVSVIFCTDGYDYRIGTPEEVEESIMVELELFHLNMPREEIKSTPLYSKIKESTKSILSLEELESAKVPVYKIFVFSMDTKMLGEMDRRLQKNKNIAVASSFPTNLEITDVRAQKGPVLKEYIESLGYTMDEVMVLGDSLNDMSMISMDFGATVAMGNADDEVKRAASHVTKTNDELGVAYAIGKLLEDGTLEELLHLNT